MVWRTRRVHISKSEIAHGAPKRRAAGSVASRDSSAQILTVRRQIVEPELRRDGAYVCWTKSLYRSRNHLPTDVMIDNIRRIPLHTQFAFRS
jgi:hypothetical protein